MKVVEIVGPSDSGKTTLVERLAARLAERGRVGTVKHINCEPGLDTAGKDTARHRAAGASETYGIADGEWFATGESISLDEALGRLSRSCDYALVEGYRGYTLPTVALGSDVQGYDDGTGGIEANGSVAVDSYDDGASGPTDHNDGSVGASHVIARAASADDVDLPALLESIEAVEPYETPSSLVARVNESADADRASASATVTGRVRATDHPDDDPTEYLEFERTDAVTGEELE